MSRAVAYLGHGAGRTRSGALFRSAAAHAGAAIAGRVANTAVNAASNYLYNTGADLASRAFSGIRSYSGTNAPRSGRMLRRMRLRRGRRGFRRRRYSRRGSNWRGRVRKPKWTGRRYTKRSRRLNLDTNFSRNDRDSKRSMTYLGTLTVDNSASVNNNESFVVNGGLAQSNFPAEFTKYAEFKLSKVQVVCVPRTVGQNQSTFQLDAIQLPYLLVKEGDPADLGTPSISYSDALQTPGYRYIPILRKSRSVFNLSPGMTVDSSVIEFGANVSIERRRSIGWLKTDSASIGLDQCLLEVLYPRLSLGSDPLLYDFYAYMTVSFRGNKVDLVAP